MRVIIEKDTIHVKVEEEDRVFTRVFDKKCTEQKAFACEAFDHNGTITRCQRLFSDGHGVKCCRGD